MREIKFRAWFKDSKWIMVAEFTLEDLMDKATSSEQDWFVGGGIKIAQYTGLKDKNGKEIYEGDILYFQNKHIEKYAEILWEDKSCRYVQKLLLKFSSKNKKDVRCWASATKSIEKMEVIGNVYENPNLLK